VTRKTLILIALAAALVAAPLFAQEAAPRFYIERIEVRENSRVTADVIVAESRLRAGAEYSESELRDAANRLSRLPFLLNADFSLERGSERGRHVLVITVNETRSFFYRFQFVPVLANPGVAFDTTSNLGNDDSAVALGYRWFLGKRGALHVGLIGRDSTEFTRGYTAFAIGYTAYDLFGTRAFATLNVKKSPEQDGITPQVVVGIPLSLNQTLTAEYDQSQVDYDFEDDFQFADRESQRVARMTWSYNTTNHPVVPTEGTLVSAGPVVAWRDEMASLWIVYADGTFEKRLMPVHTTTYGVQGSALRYWEISDRNSVSLGGEAGLGRSEERSPGSKDTADAFYGVVQAGFSRSLWTPERRAQGGDSRLELTLRGRARENDQYHEDRIYYRPDNDVVQTSFTWVRHSSWGTVRLGVGYAW